MVFGGFSFWKKKKKKLDVVLTTVVVADQLVNVLIGKLSGLCL